MTFVFCLIAFFGVSWFFFLMIRRPPRSTLDRSSAASDVYKRQPPWRRARAEKPRPLSFLSFPCSSTLPGSWWLVSRSVDRVLPQATSRNRFPDRSPQRANCGKLPGIFAREVTAMDDTKAQLLRWIDEDREAIVAFLCDFVRAKSPNPPGDTTLAAAHVTRFLTLNQLPFRVIAPQATMPNIVGSFEGARPGHHLVLNGHMDVFPADEANERWTHGPWSGAIADGKIYGRGVADMKAGTSASIFTYRYLHRLRERLARRLTLTAVSDEETFGPWGARYLMEHHPEVHGLSLIHI